MALNYRRFMRGTAWVSPTSIDESIHAKYHSKVQSAYDADKQEVTFKTYMSSFSHRGVNHIVMITFENVPPDQLYKDERSVEENRSRNGGQLIPIPILSQNPIRVRCSCPSFRFTGSEAAMHVDAFIGRQYRPWRPRRSNRASRNPNNEPMLCKHLIAFIDFLKDRGYVVQRSDHDIESQL